MCSPSPDLSATLNRLTASNFFADKPVSQSKGDYLAAVALREARRWGLEDPLANYYLDLANFARSVGA